MTARAMCCSCLERGLTLACVWGLQPSSMQEAMEGGMSWPLTLRKERPHHHACMPHLLTLTGTHYKHCSNSMGRSQYARSTCGLGTAAELVRAVQRPSSIL